MDKRYILIIILFFINTESISIESAALNANISKCYGSLLVFDEILKDNSKITYEKLTFYKFEDYVKHKLNKSFNKEKYIQEGIERAERLLKIKNNKYKYIDSLILGCRQTFKAAK